MSDYDHDLEEGDEVYDSELDEVRTVDEVDEHGTVVWEGGWTETATSVDGNFDRGEYEKQ